MTRYETAKWYFTNAFTFYERGALQESWACLIEHEIIKPEHLYAARLFYAINGPESRFMWIALFNAAMYGELE